MELLQNGANLIANDLFFVWTGYLFQTVKQFPLLQCKSCTTLRGADKTNLLCSDGNITVYDILTGEALHTLTGFEGAAAAIQSLQYVRILRIPCSPGLPLHTIGTAEASLP